MADLINRQDAIKEIARWIGYLDEDMIFRIQTRLKKVPSADAAPVVHAHWIVQKKPVYISSAEHPLSKPTKLYIPDSYTCSMCGRREPYQEPYCHCGAKMDEKEKEDT